MTLNTPSLFSNDFLAYNNYHDNPGRNAAGTDQCP